MHARRQRILLHRAAQLVERIGVAAGARERARRRQPRLDAAGVRTRLRSRDGGRTVMMPVVASPYAIFAISNSSRGSDAAIAAQVALAIDHRQHLPLVRQQIEHRAARRSRLRTGASSGIDVDVGNDVRDARPLVDAPRAFHEQRFGRHRDARVDRHLAARTILEREEALAPRHQLEHDALLDLLRSSACVIAPFDERRRSS